MAPIAMRPHIQLDQLMDGWNLRQSCLRNSSAVSTAERRTSTAPSPPEAKAVRPDGRVHPRRVWSLPTISGFFDARFAFSDGSAERLYNSTRLGIRETDRSFQSP